MLDDKFYDNDAILLYFYFICRVATPIITVFSVSYIIRVFFPITIDEIVRFEFEVEQ